MTAEARTYRANVGHNVKRCLFKAAGVAFVCTLPLSSINVQTATIDAKTMIARAVTAETEAAWKNTESLLELTEVLNKWLDENTNFERPKIKPIIRTVSSSVAASVGNMSGSRHGRTRGLFDPESSTVYLVKPWDRKDPHDASVLLHELVHARQVSKHYYCPGAQEEAAYGLQDEWLRSHGLQAKVNWIAVVLEAGCAPRDFHPD